MTKEGYMRRFPYAQLIGTEWRDNNVNSHIGQVAWNVGLTKETNQIVKQYSESMSNHQKTKEHCLRISETKQVQFLDEEFKERMLKNLGDNPYYWRKPNKPETRMLEILNQYYPNTWKYVGDGKVIIGSYNPDFIRIDGKKQLIEIFGDYWHRDTNPQDKIDFYAEVGFATLVFWEHEVYEDVNYLLYMIDHLPSDSHANAELNCNNDLLHKCVETIDSASFEKMLSFLKDDDIVQPLLKNEE